MIAPDAPRPFPPKSISTMEVFIVTGLLSSRSPLNVNVDKALLSEDILMSVLYLEGI
jgi:hypothetical protein